MRHMATQTKKKRVRKDPVPSRELLAQNLRVLRALNKWTQTTLSEKSGVDIKFLVDLEAGARKPSLNTVDKLANAFGLEPFEMIRPRDRGAR